MNGTIFSRECNDWQQGENKWTISVIGQNKHRLHHNRSQLHGINQIQIGFNFDLEKFSIGIGLFFFFVVVCFICCFFVIVAVSIAFYIENPSKPFDILSNYCFNVVVVAAFPSLPLIYMRWFKSSTDVAH